MIGWLLRRVVRILRLVLLTPLRLLGLLIGLFASRDVLVLRVRGPLEDLPRREPLWRRAMRTRPPAPSLEELLAGLGEAARDRKLKAVLLRFEQASVSLVQAEALMHAVDRLQAAGKRVVVWADPLTGPALVIAAAADRAYGVPEGQLELTGVRMRAVFLHDFLVETLGIAPQLQRHGDYKTMADTFMARGMTPAHEEMARDLAGDLYEQLITPLIVGRGLAREAVVAAVDDAPLGNPAAVERGLLDGVAYRDELLARAGALLGGEPAAPAPAELGVAAAASTTPSPPSGPPTPPAPSPPPTPSAPPASPPPPEPSAPGAAAQPGPPTPLEPAEPSTCELGLMLARRRARERRAAVLRDPRTIRVFHLHGTIAPGEVGRGILSEPTIEALEAAREARRVAAVVLRIDSPGGSATASDTIWRAVERLAQEKPVVASFGSVAASGGYYIAAAAREIFAAAATLTGSIGIVSGKFHLAPALHRWGVRVEGVAVGKRAAMYDPDRPASPEELAALEREMMRFYWSFVARVAQGRRMSVEAVDQIAQGRVYTGRRAQALGLVDRLGDVEAAIARAAELAGLRRWAVDTIHPTPRGGLARLIASDAAALAAGPHALAAARALDDALRLAGEPVLAYCPWRADVR